MLMLPMQARGHHVHIIVSNLYMDKVTTWIGNASSTLTYHTFELAEPSIDDET